MRDDVLKAISSAKDVSNAIILTHNIDFVFVQTIALAAFRRCGHPTITIFADAACAAESFAQQQPALAGLGVRYRVVPVAMGPGFRFHPKAVFLSGEEAATLLVGSGNLTFGGWRENAEIWLRFDSTHDSAAPFHAFKGYLTSILARLPLPEAVAAEVDEAFDPKNKPWLSTEPIGDARLIGRMGSGSSLLDQMLGAASSDPIDELVICSPYFDDHGIALGELVARVDARRATVLCQPERSTLTQRSWKSASGRAVLQRVDLTRVSAHGERSAFVHGKFYAFRRSQEVLVMAGSANCSRAALTTSGRSGNAELQAVQSLTPAEFEAEFLGELKLSAEPVALRDVPATDDAVDGGSTRPVLRVLAARFEVRSLLVAYTPPTAEVMECLVDAVTIRFEIVGKGILRAICAVEPRVVAVLARVDGEILQSVPTWIDHERHLRSTARGRSLADSIRARIQPGEWNASGWADVLDVFCKHLSYMPVRAGRATSRGLNKGKPGGEVEFTAADVFSPGYRRPNLGSIRIPFLMGESGHIKALQQLLLRWFGMVAEESEGEGRTPGSSDSDEGDDNDDIVDRPESLQLSPWKPSATDFTERDKRRIETLLGQLEDAMTSTEFLATRGAEYLAADLRVASALLRLGLREGWVELKRFFDLTQRVWVSLFFSSEPQGNVGWLEHRARMAEDREAFAHDMQSAELSAALIGWKLAITSNDATPEASRFALAAVLAVARLPWLWQGGEPGKIAEELAVLLSHTADPSMSREALMNQAEAEWTLLMRRGQALRLLEAAVNRTTPAEIRDRIRADELRPGELLWQGTAGFCVVRHRASRADDRVAVLRLQSAAGEVQFKGSFTIPFRALLDEEVIPPSDAFGGEPRAVLSEFVDELRTGFAG